MRIGALHWDRTTDSAEVRLTEAFQKEARIAQLDVLRDLIEELTLIYKQTRDKPDA